MDNVNWCFVAEDEGEDSPRSRPVNDAFRGLVHVLTGKARVKMLSPEKETDLVLAWQEQGNQDALKDLVCAFDPLILRLAKKIGDQHKVPQHIDDLYQIGIESFIKGLKRYRVDNGNRLSSFIKYALVGDMTHFAMGHRLPMRTGTSVYERKAYYQHRAAADAIKAEEGRRPGDSPADLAAIAARIGVGVPALKRAKATHSAQVLSIDTVQVWTEAEHNEDIARVRKLIVEAFADLDAHMIPRDVAIARAYLPLRGDKDALDRVADEHDLSRERIRQIARAALALIRESLAQKGFSRIDDVMSVA